jgi:hypothetical protein
MEIKKVTIILCVLPLIFASVATASAASATTLQVKITGEDKTSFNWTLKCQPNSGTHPKVSTACKFLNTTAGKKAILELPKNEMCTEIYGGGITARIFGNFKGKKVDLRLDRKNGCKIAQWDSLMKVLVKR